ncbi:MAG: hypothetical protein N2C14_17705, partial [Planctomycetales bacterium]
MNIIEVIQKANTFVSDTAGISRDPVFVRLVTKPGIRDYWMLVYQDEIFCAKELERGTVIDGGEYIVKVDAS